MRLLIGVDWSQEHHNVRIQNEAGALVVGFQIAHSPDGLAKLEGEIAKLGVPPAKCLIALETAHNLLVDFFWSRGYQIYVVAPSVVCSSRGLCWLNNTSVLVSAVIEVESRVAGRAGSRESVCAVAQPSGYHRRPQVVGRLRSFLG
jgi:hypothetical protein